MNKLYSESNSETENASKFYLRPFLVIVRQQKQNSNCKNSTKSMVWPFSNDTEPENNSSEYRLTYEFGVLR